MRYHEVTSCDIVNGVGLRVVLFVSGCNHYCKGCQNKSTWDPESGKPFTEEIKQKILEELSYSYCSGITFTGGDPLYPDNRAEITALAKEIKEKFPDKTIWLYTGYTYEEIKDLDIMQYVDVLVDGEFIEELKSYEYAWAGSTNQRVIDVRESMKYGCIREFKQ